MEGFARSNPEGYADVEDYPRDRGPVGGGKFRRHFESR